MGQLANRAQADQEARSPTAMTKRVVFDLVEGKSQTLRDLLPDEFDINRFKKLLLVATDRKPELLQCTPQSFIQAGITAAILGLEPDDPRQLAYLLVSNDKNRGKVAEFRIGYRGLMELAYRTGRVGPIRAHVVYRADRFKVVFGDAEEIWHEPDLETPHVDKDITHAYAITTIDGRRQALVMTRAEIDKRRDKSPSARSEYSPWSGWFEDMAIKTVIRAICRYLPMSVEAQTALAQDAAGEPVRIGDLELDDAPALPAHRAEWDDAIDIVETEEHIDEAPQLDPDDPTRPF